jgi:hypothetical protein
VDFLGASFVLAEFTETSIERGMTWTADSILGVWDACCRKFSFPSLGNGHLHLAASRLFLYRSENDWAMTIEVFGFSPRSGEPEVQVYTSGSKLVNRPGQEDFFNDHAWHQHQANHPHDETRFVFPLESGSWQDGEQVASGVGEVVVRGNYVPLPSRHEYEEAAVQLADPDRIQVYELCRYLAATRRELVLCTPEELVVNLPPELKLVLKLDEWHHPDLSSGETAGSTETFRQLAAVLETGDVTKYGPTELPNTHWKNWPGSGTF